MKIYNLREAPTTALLELIFRKKPSRAIPVIVGCKYLPETTKVLYPILNLQELLTILGMTTEWRVYPGSSRNLTDLFQRDIKLSQILTEVYNRNSQSLGRVIDQEFLGASTFIEIPRFERDRSGEDDDSLNCEWSAQNPYSSSDLRQRIERLDTDRRAKSIIEREVTTLPSYEERRGHGEDKIFDEETTFGKQCIIGYSQETNVHRTYVLSRLIHERLVKVVREIEEAQRVPREPEQLRFNF